MTREAPLVVVTDVTDLDPRPGIEILQQHGYRVEVLDLATDPAVPGRARDAVAAIVGYAQVTATTLAGLPRLRLIATTSTGTDMVDTAAAGRAGVEVIGLLGVSTREVATHALTLTLAAVRGLPESLRVTAAGGWTAQVATVPRPAEELTLGLYGYGRIARELARIARPIVGRIIAHDPYAPPAAGPTRLVSADDLLARADVLSLHVPVTTATRHLIGASQLDRMPRGAVLVNVSRGELVDHDAIRAALEDGRLAHYAADVLDGEPPAADDPLRRHPRATITPHVGFLSTASLRRYLHQPAETIVERLPALLASPALGGPAR